MSLSRIVVLSWDGCILANIGSARPDDEARVLAFVEEAASPAGEGAVPVVIVHGALEVKQAVLTVADLDDLVRLLLEANKRAHTSG